MSHVFFLESGSCQFVQHQKLYLYANFHALFQKRRYFLKIPRNRQD